MHESTPLLATLRLIKPGLSPALTQLAEFIEDNLSSVSRMTVTELAEVADVSVSSVSRLSRELGYRNYGDFKMAAHSSISFVPNVNSGAEVDVLDEAEPDDHQRAAGLPGHYLSRRARSGQVPHRAQPHQPVGRVDPDSERK